jgi:hypothetical protein
MILRRTPSARKIWRLYESFKKGKSIKNFIISTSRDSNVGVVILRIGKESGKESFGISKRCP